MKDPKRDHDFDSHPTYCARQCLGLPKPLWHEVSRLPCSRVYLECGTWRSRVVTTYICAYKPSITLANSTSGAYKWLIATDIVWLYITTLDLQVGIRLVLFEAVSKE